MIKEFEIIEELKDYIQSTYSDKYEDSVIKMREFTKSDYGKGFNMGNSLKYHSRYLSKGYDKSNQKQDLFKMIHYILFELERIEK
jgi:hypothetical protein